MPTLSRGPARHQRPARAAQYEWRVRRAAVGPTRIDHPNKQGQRRREPLVDPETPRHRSVSLEDPPWFVATVAGLR